MDFLTKLFDTSDFPARWHCGTWTAGHGWLHILSDLGVWSAYVAIPFVLLYFILRREDLPFRRIFLLFGAFILACGTTHLMEALIFWWPAYRLAGVIKLCTAIVSWGTVLALVPVVPRALAMRSPEELEREIEARRAAEDALQRVNDDLERRIADRTAKLADTNKVLQEERERFLTLADNIPQLAWMANADGHIFWYNRRWYDYTGTTFEQMRGWGWQSVHDPATLPSVVERWQQSLASGEPFDMIFPLKGADGVFRPFLTRVMPVKDAEGKVARWFGTNTDVTAQRQMEEALRDADRKKDDFLAVLSHELRNPLAPLRNGLQILRLTRGQGEAADQARAMMERQFHQMVRLVDDLLDVSRITRGKIELRREVVELAAVIGSAVETCRPVVEAANHHLTVSLPAEPIHVEGDLTRLSQVFANLLNNAAKYTPKGGRIEVTAVQKNREVLVTVRDSGVGIPPGMLSSVFQMFTQVDQSLEKAQGGLGIGLTIVQRLVEMHGGKVEARSDGPGKGSTFVVHLPASSSVGAASEVGTDGAVASSATAARKILVVDDNKDAASSLGMMLRLLGNEVRLAHDGMEAVETAGAYRPELILMDIGMPRLNGYEATRRIREQPWAAGVRIIALTGWGQDEDQRRSREAGCDAHLVKPIDPAALQGVLGELTASR